MDPVSLLTNTILVPYHDSLVSSNPLPANTLAGDLSASQNSAWKPALRNIETVYIKVNGGASQKVINIQSVDNFSMQRENQQKMMGDYVVNLPGNITYSDITITHLFTREHYFLDWLTNGVNQGGVSRADIEIFINVKNNDQMGMVFTLYDAFPIHWEVQDEVMIDEEVTALCEKVILTFSKLSFEFRKLTS